jgi:hypothetical protein
LTGIVVLGASLVNARAEGLRREEAGILATDALVLDSRAPRNDLACHIEVAKPFLGFDLRFHSYYFVTTPPTILGLGGSSLLAIARITPANQDRPAYFLRRVVMPRLLAEAKGMGSFTDGFEVGRGHYLVDWMMRDEAGRSCSSHWELEAKPSFRERNVPLTLGENTIGKGPAPVDGEPGSGPGASQGLRVKILLNVSPPGDNEILLKPKYASVLMAMLRTIVRDPDVSSVSLIAFNLRAQKIVYRRDDYETLDFAPLGNVLDAPDAGIVNYRLLQDRHSEAHFVTKLLTDHLGSGAARQDAIIILGAKVSLQQHASIDLLKKGGAAPCPIFYLNYNPNPFDQPFPDTIGSALKAYGSASKYEIVQPHDFGTAMREMLLRLGRQPGAETLF